MQIHEITEGFWKNVGRGFIQGTSGVDFDKTLATSPQAQNKIERITVSVSQPNQTVPAKYYKILGKWTNELGQQITGMKQKSYLEKLVPTHGKKDFVEIPLPGTRTQQTSRKSRTTP